MVELATGRWARSMARILTPESKRPHGVEVQSLGLQGPKSEIRVRICFSARRYCQRLETEVRARVFRFD